MSRPSDSRLNRSGHGQLSERDQKPPLGEQIEPEERDGHRVKPEEQSSGHEHADADKPDHVHPALAMDEGTTESEDA